MQVSLDYLLQFKIDNKALLQCIEAGNNKLRFTKAHFIKNYLIFIMTCLKAMTTFTKFKTDMLLQALSTRVFDFQIEHRHISIEAYRNYLLNIYLDEVERND